MQEDDAEPQPQTEMTLTWWGHSTVGIELGGVRILTDPVLRRWVGPLRRTGQLPAPTATAELNAILISHAHHDHLDLPSLRGIDRETTVVLPAGRGELVRREGFVDVVELRVGESTTIGTVECTAVPAHHTGARWRAGNSSPAQGYLLRGTRSVWFAGDTGMFDGLADLRGLVDVGLIPIGGWGITLAQEHLDAAQAAAVCALLELPAALPIHWGTLALPGSRVVRAAWRRQDARRFVELVRPPTRACIPAIGERVVLLGTTGGGTR